MEQLARVAGRASVGWEGLEGSSEGKNPGEPGDLGLVRAGLALECRRSGKSREPVLARVAGGLLLVEAALPREALSADWPSDAWRQVRSSL